MIPRYNGLQTVFGVLCAVGSLLGYAAAYFFFRYFPHLVARQFGFHPSGLAMACFACGILALITFSGYRLWKRRGGFYGYHESSLYHDLGDSTAGAVVVDHYAHRITGPAYVLAQVFLAGPLLALRSASHFRNRITQVEGLEERLVQVLGRLREANRWQGFEDQPDCRGEILLLAKMGRIDFSAAKGHARFKAFPPDGI
jgi:hypothetical protein